MNSEVIRALESLSEKWGIAIDWTSKNVLPYLQELMGRIIRYELITSVFYLLVSVAMVLSAKLWLKYISYCNKRDEEDRFGDYGIYAMLAIVGMFICVTFGTVIIICQIEDIIKCIVLPESILLQYIKYYM